VVETEVEKAADFQKSMAVVVQMMVDMMCLDLVVEAAAER